MSGFNDKIKVHTAPGSGTQYVHTIDLLYTQEEKNALYEEAMNQAKTEMSELLPCPFCGSEAVCEEVARTKKFNTGIFGVCCTKEVCFVANGTTTLFVSEEQAIEAWNTRYSKYPLAPVSSTLDRLLDSGSDLAAEAEADLGEIEHKGEKLMVKIKVVRGE